MTKFDQANHLQDLTACARAVLAKGIAAKDAMPMAVAQGLAASIAWGESECDRLRAEFAAETSAAQQPKPEAA